MEQQAAKWRLRTKIEFLEDAGHFWIPPTGNDQSNWTTDRKSAQAFLNRHPALEEILSEKPATGHEMLAAINSLTAAEQEPLDSIEERRAVSRRLDLQGGDEVEETLASAAGQSLVRIRHFVEQGQFQTEAGQPMNPAKLCQTADEWRRETRQVFSERGLTIVRQEGGTFAIHDAQGREVGI